MSDKICLFITFIFEITIKVHYEIYFFFSNSVLSVLVFLKINSCKYDILFNLLK